MVKALPNTSFLPVPKSAPAGHTTAAAHLLWQVFPRYPCLEYKDNSGQSCPVRYTWTASFGPGLMFWQKWFNLTPQFVAYQLPGHLLHPHWYFTAYSSICQVLLGTLNGIVFFWMSKRPISLSAVSGTRKRTSRSFLPNSKHQLPGETFPSRRVWWNVSGQKSRPLSRTMWWQIVRADR